MYVSTSCGLFQDLEVGLSLNLVYMHVVLVYMKIHVLSILALIEESKKGNPPAIYIPDQHKNTKHIYMYVVRGTWIPSLENWGSGLNVCVRGLEEGVNLHVKGPI